MKTKLLFASLMVLSVFQTNAQTTVTVDAAAAWTGYANVFDNGTYQFGNAWALDAVRTDLNTTANSITLYPNFNTYNASDPYWSNGEIGNKTFEGNSFIENAALAGQTLTFTATVQSNTFASGYTVIAFIKGLNPATNYSTDVLVTTPLVNGQTFSITAPSIPSGLIVQYGFAVTGLNANPAQEAQLGNAVIVPNQLAVTSLNKPVFSAFPNPTDHFLNIQSDQNIESLSVFNIMGQQIYNEQLQKNTAVLDVSKLQTGMYLVKATINGKSTTSRIIKN